MLTVGISPSSHAIDAWRPHGITSDGTTGTVISGSGAFTITGGDRQGGNLFHSFGKFNIHSGESSTIADSGVDNTISRVTGSDYSWLNGTFKSSADDAYLINPNNALFGNNATLDTSGSVHMSTADYLRLGSGSDRYYADLGQSSSFTTASPEAFGFLDSSIGEITVDGAQLAVPVGKTLSLIGGEIEILNGAKLTASGGRVNLSSVKSMGEVVPSASNLDVTSFSSLDNITLSGGSTIDISGAGAGSLYIRSDTFTANNGSIDADTTGAQNGGTVSIEARQIQFSNGAAFDGRTTSTGNGVDATLKATETVSFDNTTIRMEASGAGSGGDFTIETPEVTGSLNTSGSVVFDISNAGEVTLTGSGTMTKQGAGTLTLDSATNYSGTVSVNQGILKADGAAIGNFSLNAGATHEVNSNETSVTGTVTINNATLSITDTPDLTYLIIDNDGADAVTGTFGTLSTDLFLSPSVAYDGGDGNDVVLTFTSRVTDAAQTSNQAAIGEHLDQTSANAAGDIETVILELSRLSASGVRAGLDQVGGASHGGYTANAFDMAAHHMANVSWRNQGFHQDRSLFDLTGTDQFSFSGPQPAMDLNHSINDDAPLILTLGNASSPESAEEWSIWAKGYTISGKREGDDIASRYDHITGGVTFGLDFMAKKNLLLGISGGYSQTELDFHDLDDSGNSGSTHLTPYGAYHHGPWYMQGALSFAHNSYDTTRKIAFGGINRQADGEYDEDQISAYLESGYRLSHKNLEVQPLASLQLSYLSRESFRETGAGTLNLEVDAEETLSLRGSLGVSIIDRFTTSGGTAITSQVRARWSHDFAADDHSIDAQLSGSSAGSYNVKGDDPDRNSVILGAGFHALLKEDHILTVQYEAKLSSNHIAHAMTAGMTWLW